MRLHSFSSFVLISSPAFIFPFLSRPFPPPTPLYTPPLHLSFSLSLSISLWLLRLDIEVRILGYRQPTSPPTHSHTFLRAHAYTEHDFLSSLLLSHHSALIWIHASLFHIQSAHSKSSACHSKAEHDKLVLYKNNDLKYVGTHCGRRKKMNKQTYRQREDGRSLGVESLNLFSCEICVLCDYISLGPNVKMLLLQVLFSYQKWWEVPLSSWLL